MIFSSRRGALALGTLSLLVLLSIACGACGSFGNPRRPPPTPSPSSTAGRGAADIGEVVTARSVGPNNEPQDITETFSRTDPVIYMVAKIRRLGAGTSVLARWARDGRPFEDSPTIIADRNYTDAWLQFQIRCEQQGDICDGPGSFKPGNYTVTLYVNGDPLATRDFVVR